MIFSGFSPENAKKVYVENTTCKSLYHTLPGYVNEKLINVSDCYLRSKVKRIDVVTGQELFLYGQGPEKSYIGKMFLEKTKSQRLK